MYDYGDCLVEFQGVSGPKAEKVYFDVYRRKEWLTLNKKQNQLKKK